jgi:hypothetical protein
MAFEIWQADEEAGYRVPLFLWEPSSRRAASRAARVRGAAELAARAEPNKRRGQARGSRKSYPILQWRVGARTVDAVRPARTQFFSSIQEL